VKLLAGAGAGNVKEALALGGLARVLDPPEPFVECVRLLASAGDGGEHDVCGAVFRYSRRVDLRPVEQARSALARHALERGRDDDVPLQALGVVDGEKFNAGSAGRNRVGFGVELLQTLLECREIDSGAGRFE